MSASIIVINLKSGISEYLRDGDISILNVDGQMVLQQKHYHDKTVIDIKQPAKRHISAESDKQQHLNDEESYKVLNVYNYF